MIDRADIDALIENAAENLGQIRELYDGSLLEQKVPAKLRARIKNVLEDQRSALEYLAHAIYTTCGDGNEKRSYYPIANKPGEFRGLVNGQLPGVGKNCPDVIAAIEARQPYRDGYEWLHHLAMLTNENKHRKLTPQTRQETPILHADFETPLSLQLKAGQRLQITATEMLLDGKVIQRPQTRNVIYVDWLFTDPPLSALATLERIQDSLAELIDAVSAALP